MPKISKKPEVPSSLEEFPEVETELNISHDRETGKAFMISKR